MSDGEPVDPVGGRTAIRVGMATILVAFGGFGTWAATAPLDSAAVAHGEVKVESYRKTLQHREGGIVRAILVKDGDRVQAGQPVMLLDDTTIRAQWRQYLNEYYDALAAKARLIAERDGLDQIDFATWMPKRQDPRIDEVQRAQEHLFTARKELFGGQVSVLKRRMEQMQHEAQSLAVEQRSKDRQLTIIAEEIDTAEKLFKRGLGLKPRLLALKREAEQLQGERDDYGARISRVHQAMAATELEITNVTLRQLDEVARQLKEADVQIRGLEEKLTAAEDMLRRSVIRAPQTGVVVGLKVHTKGAVLQPGEAVMDVVPRDDVLVVEAQIKPEDIDRVHAGREARIRFHAFLRGLTPPVDGQVTNISADLFRDEKTGAGYYLARVAMDADSVKRLPGPITPGMQTDVLITTGERTALDYVLSPLTRAMDLAMRER